MTSFYTTSFECGNLGTLSAQEVTAQTHCGDAVYLV